MYDGGSDKDAETDNSAPSPITSLRNQLFLKFTTSNGNGVGKGFTAKITFGNRITTYVFIYMIIDYHFFQFEYLII